MLKKFFFNALSSFVGAWVALALFGLAAIFILIGMAARMGISEGSAPSLKGNSIFKLELSGEIEETETARRFNPRELLTNNMERPVSLQSLVTALGEAKVNKSIKALYISCEGVAASPATLHALRLAIADFKKSGKKVYAYGDQLAQSDYYVASLADSIFLNPAGGLDLHGVGGAVLYYKDLFDKLGVRFTVCKVGTFKSAVEPYISNEMSAPARAQLDTLYGNIWRFITSEIETSRKMKPNTIDSIMRGGITMLRPCEDMVKARLVDRLVYGREMKQILARISGQDPEKLSFVSAGDLTMQTPWGTAYGSKKQVAVLYATGEIAEGSSNGIDCEKLVPEIVKLAEDKNIKALVLRVNSPGGSVFGSDQIGEALGYFKSKGKPFIVSMGDYAASGGYWISCEGDRIFADPMTITGSIGIFGLMPNISNLLAKIGVTPQSVSTNPEAGLNPLLVPLTENQIAQLQRYIEEGYRRFTTRVADGRDLPLSDVLRIAEGRVWDGQTAVRLKLVDQLGTLQEAIDYAAEKASLKSSYDVAVYPQYEPSVWDMISLGTQLGIGEAFDSYLETLETNRELLDKGIQIVRRKPAQALAPEIEWAF